MRIAQLTDKGVEKLVNEDSLFTSSWEFRCEAGIERYELLIVADGIGGAAAGDLASGEVISVMVETITRAFCACYREPRSEPCGRDLGWLLRSALELANLRLYRIAEANPGFKGMGATVVAALAHGDTLHVAHVGDCRLYRLREGVLQRLTKDHSLVQLMVDQGKISPEEAFRHPNDNLILRAVGPSETVVIEVHRHDHREGDVLFLASDGAVSDLPVEHLLQLCRRLGESPSEETLQRFCRALLKGAIDPTLGATLDNLSVVAACVDRLVPCVERHRCQVLPYGEPLPVDRETVRALGPTLPYGVDLPDYRLYGTPAPAWPLEAVRPDPDTSQPLLTAPDEARPC
ncbi:MAG TPA: protein phosphatase 2C domain-containing protein [Armatimonadota bacterium]|nr:protein phosphatase 2C domain-containing protein [Armatimonadota bacterium]